MEKTEGTDWFFILFYFDGFFYASYIISANVLTRLTLMMLTQTSTQSTTRELAINTLCFGIWPEMFDFEEDQSFTCAFAGMQTLLKTQFDFYFGNERSHTETVLWHYYFFQLHSWWVLTMDHLPPSCPVSTCVTSTLLHYIHKPLFLLPGRSSHF